MQDQSFTAKISRNFLSNKCSVTLNMPDGENLRVKGFEHESVAQYWLEHEAKNWLRQMGRWFDMGLPEKSPLSVNEPAVQDGISITGV